MDKIKRRPTIAEDRGISEALDRLAVSIKALSPDRKGALAEHMEEKELATGGDNATERGI